MAEKPNIRKIVTALEDRCGELHAIAFTARALFDEVETGDDRQGALTAMHWLIDQLATVSKESREDMSAAASALLRADGATPANDIRAH